MNILAILGSPRPQGNTAGVLDRFDRLAAAQHQVERIRITDVQVAGCIGCDSCQAELDRPGCFQEDDAEQIFDRIAAADAVVYAAPVYCWCFPAQMKALMDRHYCLVKWRDGKVARALVEGKPAALLVTCGGDEAGNADLISQVFAREMEYLRARNVGTFAVAECSTPERLPAEADTVAERLLRSLTKASDRVGPGR
jgi:multimeric flavodoxin WrbA